MFDEVVAQWGTVEVLVRAFDLFCAGLPPAAWHLRTRRDVRLPACRPLRASASPAVPSPNALPTPAPCPARPFSCRSTTPGELGGRLPCPLLPACRAHLQRAVLVPACPCRSIAVLSSLPALQHHARHADDEGAPARLPAGGCSGACSGACRRGHCLPGLSTRRPTCLALPPPPPALSLPPSAQMKAEQWQEVIDVNLSGVFYATQVGRLRPVLVWSVFWLGDVGGGRRHHARARWPPRTRAALTQVCLFVLPC